LFLSGLIVGTFVDIEHLIVPDEITIGGMVVGVICSAVVPCWALGEPGGLLQVLHDKPNWYIGLWKGALGAGVGAGVIYAVVRGGKLVFGRQHIALPTDAKIVFSETAVHLPEGDVPYEDLFYRKSDVIALQAKTVELADRCYRDITVRLSPEKLRIGEDEFNPEEVPHMEVVSEEIVLPREAMGFGDVKFMGAIGAFLGWKAVFFTLTVSALIGSAYGITMIATKRQTWSGRLWFCPFMALAATLWIFAGPALVGWYERFIQHMLGGQ
jgi:leader peptidase (prepilin peptidase)/N-methyltransferase